MAGVAERQAARIRRAEARDHAAEIGGEVGLGEQHLEFAESMPGAADRGRVLPQPFRHLAQNPMHLARLFLGEAHQLVVQLDGFQRLEEQRVAGAAGAVDHALDAALLAGNQRHHEAVITNSDVVFLEHAVLPVYAQEALERFLDGLLLALQIAAQPAERDAGMIGNRAVGKDLAGQVRQQAAKFAESGRARREAREASRGGRQDGARVRSPVEHVGNLEDLLRFEPRSLDPELRHRGADVGDRVEVQPDGGASGRGLRLR